MKKVFIISLGILLLNAVFSAAQSELRQSGPMVGYSTMREVLLWVQTTESAAVHFEYWVTANPGQRYQTDAVETVKKTAFTAKCYADQVEPGLLYEYELFINNQKVERPYPLRFQTPTLWQWREDAPDFKFVFGSGCYINETPYDRPGQPYGGEYEIFDAIYHQSPDFMIWGGDNIYLREADWNSRTGILHRYTHTRSTPEIQPLLGSIHHYAIWDDHDFGPDNSDRSVWNKDVTLEAFELFWGNPSYGINGQPGTATTFFWSDAQFFLLDNRYDRAPNHRRTGERTILGQEQLEWLIDGLKSSLATFKFVVMGGQFLNPFPFGENYSAYPEEREKIIQLIGQEDINGVVFLTGDRHFSELSKLERYQDYPLYDFTASPFTSGVFKGGQDEENFLRVENTLVLERNFGQIEVTGARGERQLKMSVVNNHGEEKWAVTVHEKDLR